MKPQTAPALNLPGEPLTQADYEALARRYINPEIADAAFLRRVDPVTGAEIVGRKRSAGRNYAGLLIPFLRYDAKGTPESVREYRLRRDEPDLEVGTDSGIKESAKYLSPPGASGLIYAPPGQADADWSSIEIPVVFVEGEFKALALARFFRERKENRLVKGLTGCWNWRAVVGKTVDERGRRRSVRDVIAAPFPTEGRTVFLVPDANYPTNPQVKRGWDGLRRYLAGRGAKVVTVTLPNDLPGVNGVDDLLALKGSDYVAALFDQAQQKPRQQTVTTTGGSFVTDDAGVWFADDHGEKIFVCSAIEVVADTRDERGENWGRLLHFPDRDGRIHQWTMPVELLARPGAEWLQFLLSQGLTVGSGRRARALLEQFLNQKVDRRARCVSKTGWCNGAFVLTSETIGAPEGEEIFLQSASPNELLRVSGSIAEWRREVAAYCVGNSRLAFAVAAAFAAPLLEITGGEGGGFHFRGASSVGKTTALLTGGSVTGGHGDKGFLRRWRATANGLESVAEAHNDLLLCLDEIAEVDPREAGENAYQLANGAGKVRQTRSITLRRTLEWRLIFLSSGETGLADLMAQAGKRARGGQEVRLIDLEADAGAGLGLFENLHGFRTADALASHLQAASKRNYGTALREFLRRVVTERETIRAEAQTFTAAFLKDHVPADANGEVIRVARRFALVAFAGELASDYSVTGWIEREAARAAAQLFRSWLARRGRAGTDDEAAIRQVRLFIEQHGSSRFQRIDRSDERVINRAGYLETDEEQTVWFVLPEVFRAEVCRGFDPRQTARLLAQRGFLKTSDDLRFSKRTPDGKIKAYAITSAIIEDTQ